MNKKGQGSLALLVLLIIVIIVIVLGVIYSVNQNQATETEFDRFVAQQTLITKQPEVVYLIDQQPVETTEKEEERTAEIKDVKEGDLDQCFDRIRQLGNALSDMDDDIDDEIEDRDDEIEDIFEDYDEIITLLTDLETETDKIIIDDKERRIDNIEDDIDDNEDDLDDLRDDLEDSYDKFEELVDTLDAEIRRCTSLMNKGFATFKCESAVRLGKIMESAAEEGQDTARDVEDDIAERISRDQREISDLNNLIAAETNVRIQNVYREEIDILDENVDDDKDFEDDIDDIEDDSEDLEDDAEDYIDDAKQICARIYS